MPTITFSVSLLLAGFFPDGASQSQADRQPSSSQQTSDQQQAGRRFHEINRDLRDLLKKQATAKSRREETLAIRQLVRLYGEICQHPKIGTSDTLKSYRIKLRSRLSRIQQELEREIARSQQRSGRSQQSQSSTARLADAATAAMADQLALIGYSLGGPGKVFSQGGAMGPPDYGPALVELIQRTIAPGFWDVNGGPGTIVYYAPLRALVVRASGEIQGDVRGVLGGLRRAGN